ncbi:MAG: RluA family pseudouridine synthase [Candidatus Pacebacteria bacterium]|nr:RluA family pseudouridine synthase [Candidatus Paceibacterota bacterium]
MIRRAEICIGPDDQGTRVIDLLTRRFTYHSRQEWLQLIREDCVKVNGEAADSTQALVAGDRLAYLPRTIAEPPVIERYDILYEDESLLVIDKPGNLPCHPAGRFFEHTLWALLRRDQGKETIRFVHRLDRETSGLVLVAQSAAAARNLGAQFEKGEVEKIYWVLVEGTFPNELCIEGNLIRDPGSAVRKKRTVAPHKPGREAAESYAWTDFRRLESLGPLSLVEAKPRTGRFHQIRASLCAQGFPVVGDKLYGVDESMFIRFIEGSLSADDRTRLRMPRQALHARELRFRHPRTGETMHFEAPMPEDMKAGLDAKN